MKPANKADGRRKKRESPPASPPECAKKGKVHAQRKFAQGSGSSTHINTPPFLSRDRDKTNTSVRNASVPKSPLLTHRIPTAAQFFDFLSFGRTPLLDSSLHYLRDATLASSSSMPPPVAKSPPPVTVKKDGKLKEEKLNHENVASNVPDALRKKYHDQRLAKQKPSSVTKLAQKVKGKVMVRTRSSVSKDNLSNVAKAVLPVRNRKKSVIALRKNLQRNRKQCDKKLMSSNRQRAGLRSGGKVKEPKIVAKDASPHKPKRVEDGGKKCEVAKKSKTGRGVRVGDASSSDDEPLLPKLPPAEKLDKVETIIRTRSKEKSGITPKMFRPRRSITSVIKKEPNSVESSPHRPLKDDEYNKKKAVTTVKDKVKKQDLPSKGQIHRRATRSTPISEKSRDSLVRQGKEAVRDLIQKKKQTSLKTLKRLKKAPFKPPVEVKEVTKKRDVKVNNSLEVGKSDMDEKKEKEESAPRTLRRKTVDNTDGVKENDSGAKKPDKPAKTSKKSNKPENDAPKGNRASRRPVRKCSTVDKMWIDVDGFTSDEDGFIDTESIVLAAVAATTSDSKKCAENDGKPKSYGAKATGGKNNSESAQSTSEIKSEVVDKLLPLSSMDTKTEVSEPNGDGSSKSRDSREVTKCNDDGDKPEIAPEKEKDLKSIQEKSQTEKPDIKKGAFTKAFTSPMMNVALFPKTAAWLKSHENKDVQLKLKKFEEAGIARQETPAVHSDSHALIARLAGNIAGVVKPPIKLDTKSSIIDLKPAYTNKETLQMSTVTPDRRLGNCDNRQATTTALSALPAINPPKMSSLINEPSKALKIDPVSSESPKLAKSSLGYDVPEDQLIPDESFKMNATQEKKNSGIVDKKDNEQGSSKSSRMTEPSTKSSAFSTACKNQLSKHKESEKRKISSASSEESDSSLEKLAARKKRTRRPLTRTEIVTRKERPKRQCSSKGKSWIERDSDDSTFYDDEQDVLELIRQSEINIQRRENPKLIQESSSVGNTDTKTSDVFSDSDDEPLKKKSFFAPSPSSFMTMDTPPPKSRCDSLPRDRQGASLPSIHLPSVPDPTVMFRSLPSEPINTHGLDLLSEVADKSTDRIEQWLKQSIRADGERGFIGYEEADSRRPPVSNANIPDPVLQFVRSPPKVASVIPECSAVKKIIPKVEPQPKRPPVSSVTDLLKLQRERKGSPKPVIDHHSKNCKCNSCVVKKGWFKNKPSPEEPKPVAKEPLVKHSPPVEDSEPVVTKASVSVAPMVQSTEASTSPDSKMTSPRKRGFFERMRERGMKEALVKPQLPPFSPSNESSVYAFEPEPSLTRSVPIKPPTQRTTGTDTGSHRVETSSRSQSHQSTSIAVQVNMDTGTETAGSVGTVQDDGRSFEISTQTEGADGSHPMFYFPLPGGTAVTSQQAVIQSVTLKLGTEGSDGHNQTIVMQAKLVTEPSSPPPARKAIVMPQIKEAKMTPPVGTVQPTTRKPATSSPRPRASVSPSSSKSSQSCAKNTTPMRGRSPLTPTPTRSTKASPSPSATKRAQSSLVMEAPTFHLTEKDFSDPLDFFDRIRPAAERFGICRIVPPSSFKPDCKVADDMRFMAYNQYVHRLFHRWGPSARETMAMKKYLKTHRISLKPPPCVGGVEVDFPRLYQAVQTCGGLMKVMEKQKWQQVADLLRLPKAAHDRVTKLDSIYCQYLLPYETLSDEERNKLLNEVDAEWSAHESKINAESGADEDDDEDNDVEECEECIVKGRSMALNQFYRIARNTMSMWFKSAEPDPGEVESEFWRLVTERKQHVCVHSGSIDSSGWGYGFPIGKNNFAKHPWNLKVLTNNSGSVLRSLGPVMGVTVPTLHVGMVFAAFCWYRDPHGLPWVEYLHTGAPKIWYGISDTNSSLFRETLTKLMPKYIKEQRIWLPSDTAMVPPQRLAELGVPLSRTTQHPGQFVVVFPRAFTSSVCTGYLVSESVYFARPSWLQTAEDAFRDIHDSAEPTVFSLDNLLLSIATDNRASLELLKLVVPMVQRIRDREETGRAALRDLGLKEEPLPKEKGRRKGGRSQDPEPEQECYVCRKTLFLSMVSISAEEDVYCLQHGLDHLREHNDQISGAKLLYTHDQNSIDEVVEKLDERINTKQTKSKK